MNEESKQCAPGGASSATACEDCWRPKDGPGGCFAHERNADHYGWTEDCQRATIARLRASLSTAEKEIEHLRQALDGAMGAASRSSESASQTAPALEKALGALRAVLDVFGGHSSHWDPTMRNGAGCEQCNRELPVRVAARDLLSALSGGAHVDGLRAQPECLDCGLGQRFHYGDRQVCPGLRKTTTWRPDTDAPKAPETQKEEEK